MAINFSGPICGTGYGVVALNLLKAFDKLGHEPALFPIGPIDQKAWPDDHPLLERCLGRATFFDPSAPSLRVWHQWDMAPSHGRGKRLGFAFTELDRLKSAERHHLNSLDLVIQPSEWAAEVARRSGVTTPQVVVPCAVDTDLFWPDELPAGDDAVFVCAGKWEYRKGHDVLLHAFLKAFGPEDRVKLVMACENPFLNDLQRQEWWQYYRNHPLGDKVVIVRGRFESQLGLSDLFRRCHCGVFMARAEGFNLEAAELLAMGRHVIMTDYAGHTTYGREAGAMMIGVDDLEPAHDGIWFHQTDPAWEGKPGRWAVIGARQVEDFAAAMRDIHRRRERGELPVNHAGVHHFKNWTWDVAARQIMEAAC